MGKKASKQKGLNALKRQNRKKLFVGGVNINLNDIALPDNTVEDVKGNTTDNSSTVTTGNLQTAVDAAVSKLNIPDFDTLQQQIKTLESKVPQAYDDKDLRESIKANADALTNFKAPTAYDDKDLKEAIKANKESLDNINYDSFKYDDTNILAALQANSEALENIPEAFNPAGGSTSHSVIYGVLSSLGYIYVLYSAWMGEVAQLAKNSNNASIEKSVRILAWFVLVGWAIYPIGYMCMPGGWLNIAFGWDSSNVDLFYNIADSINKIGFGLVVYSLAIGQTHSEKGMASA